MLSYIFRIAQGFKREHGILPNLLYLNPEHAAHLTDALAEHEGRPTLSDILGMEVVINRDVVQPHVMWAQAAHRKAG